MVEERERSAFDVVWWPVDVAIAWIITRDRIFVERHWKRRGSTLSVTVALAIDSRTGKEPARYVDGVERAWAELKHLLEDAKIRIVGTPFQRLAVTAIGQTETSESQREIADSEIGSLMLIEEGDDLCLIPEDWRVARGSNSNNLRGYRNPMVRLNGVMHYFQPGVGSLPSEYLGKPATPHSPGVMSVSQAAYWIASEGGNSPFDLRDVSSWQSAFDNFIPLICSGSISVNGRKHGRGLAVPIAAACFSGITIDYPYADTPVELTLCQRPHLRCFGVVDREIWEKQCNDQLMGDDPQVPEYSHLQIVNSDLAEHFSFSATAEVARTSTPNLTLKTPALQAKIREAYIRLWPNGDYPPRSKERNQLIQAEFPSHPPSDRTIQRALRNFI